jgi:valyl-tRNA synthetase
MPHVTEDAYQESFKAHEGAVSVHVSGWPEPPPRDEASEAVGESVKGIIAGIRSWKSANALSLNAEISRVEIVGEGAMKLLSGSVGDIQKTVKAKDLELMEKVTLKESVAKIKPVFAKLGPRFKKDSKEIAEKLQKLSLDEPLPRGANIRVAMADGRMISIEPDYFELEKKIASDRGELDHIVAGRFSVLVYR